MHDDALARGEGQVPRRAARLAEPALDAAVSEGGDGRQRFQVLEVDLGIVAQHRVRVQDPLRVQQRLHPPHHPVRPVAPFVADEGRHVASRAVLGLERPVVLPHHQLDQAAHERRVAAHGGLVGEVAREHEVQVAIPGVAEHDRIGEAVAVEERAQVGDGLGEARDREHDVLDDHRRPRGTHSPHRGEQPLAQPPMLLALDPVPRKPRGGQQSHRSQRGRRPRHRRLQHGLVRLAELHQQGGGAVVDGERVRPVGGLRPQRRGVHDLEGGRACLGQGRHGGARVAQVMEEQERGGARGGIGHRAHGHLGEETKGALRADHETGQDLRGRVVVEKGVQAVAGGVLAREPVANPQGQRIVAAHLVAQREQRGVEIGPVGRQALVRAGAGRVHDGAVGEHDHRRLHRVITVLDHPAAHPRRVIGDDSAHHRGVDRRRIGPQAIPEAGQAQVDVAADDAGLRPHPPALVEDSRVAPQRRQLDQDVVAQGLPGERRARGAEGEVSAVGPRVREEGAHLIDVAGADDDLGDQTVDGSVDAAGEPVDGTREHAIEGQDPPEVRGKAHVSGPLPTPRSCGWCRRRSR